MPENSSVSRLPIDVVSRSDIFQLYRELKNLSDSIEQAAVVEGAPAPQVRVGERLARLAKVNALDINNGTHRGILLAHLGNLKEAAPVVHMAFTNEPSQATTESILSWLRREASPFVLLHVGIRPSMVAGCFVRTPTKVFDLTLRRHLEAAKVDLRERIHGLWTPT